MAVIKSGASTDQWTIDPVSKAGRITLYDTSGNYIATLPVSGTITANAGTGTFNTDGVSEALIGAAVPAEATYIGGNKSGLLTGLTLDPNNNLNVNISDVGGNAATAKGVQPAAAIPTQDLKDSGRTKIILTLTKTTAITTEALVTLTIKKGDAATTTGTSYTVTAGKILRLQSMFLGITGTATTLTNTAIRLREGAASGGAVSVTSDIVTELEASMSAALATAGGQAWAGIPDGIEIVGGQQIGVSELSSSTSGVVTIVIIGYEY